MEGEVEKSDSVTKFPAAKAIFSKLDMLGAHLPTDADETV